MYANATQTPFESTNSAEGQDHFQQIKITVYVFIFTLTMIGNGILIAAFIKFKKLRTPQNLLILNLSFCDMFLAFSILIVIADTVAGHFLLGAIGCTLLYPLTTMALNSAVLTLLSIAVERYRTITSPFNFKFTRRKSLINIAVVHVVSLLSVVPYMFHLEVWKADNKQFCIETWTLTSKRVYTLYLFFIQYGVPLPVMITLYTISWWTIRKNNIITMRTTEVNAPTVHDDHSNENINTDKNACNQLFTDQIRSNDANTSANVLIECNPSSKAKSQPLVKFKEIRDYFKKMRLRTPLKENISFEVSLHRQKKIMQTLKMFICVVTVFAICMLPNQITWIMKDFGNEGPTEVLTHIFYFFTFTNSVCNPWIYGGINPVFRRAYKVMICKHSRRDMQFSFTPAMVSRPLSLVSSFSSNDNSPVLKPNNDIEMKRLDSKTNIGNENTGGEFSSPTYC